MKKLIVGFDLTEIDEVLASYISFLAAYWQIEKIYVLHVVDSLTDGIEERQKVWNTDLPIDEFFKEKLKGIAKDFFAPKLLKKIEYIIAEGKPHEEMLRWATVKETDLIVVGRKVSLKGSGMLPQQFALNAPCSVLLVPETVEKNLDTVLASIDFSVYSRNAVEIAVDLVSQAKYASLYCQYIFDIPFGCLLWENSKAVILESKRKAEGEYEKFMREIDTKALTVIPLLAHGEEDADFIKAYENAKDIEASLIVVGARGRSFLKNIFDESFSKKLVEHNSKIPLLIVKM